MNASRKPGEWQSYDVIWTAPTFAADGSLKTPAYVTAFHNGVLVQSHFALKGETRYIGAPEYKKYDSAPIKLQAHGDPSEPISFRNIWVRSSTSYLCRGRTAPTARRCRGIGCTLGYGADAWRVLRQPARPKWMD